MKIPTGRIIMVDMGGEKWGRVLYMVVNSPIKCSFCNTVLIDWREHSGDVICPECGNVVHERNFLPCPKCHENDYYTLRVVNNNNWGYDYHTGQVTEYCDKRGIVMNVCGHSLMDDFKNQRAFLLTARESQDRKRKIVWTGSMDYDPRKEMPQEIIDMFPYSEQE